MTPPPALTILVRYQLATRRAFDSCLLFSSKPIGIFRPMMPSSTRPSGPNMRAATSRVVQLLARR